MYVYIYTNTNINRCIYEGHLPLADSHAWPPPRGCSRQWLWPGAITVRRSAHFFTLNPEV